MVSFLPLSLTRMVLVLLVTLAMTACQIPLPRGNPLPDPKSCRFSESMRLQIVGECVIYQAILNEANKVRADGMRPVAARMALATYSQLKKEFGALVTDRKASFGILRTIETPHETLLVVVDKHMPEDAFIILCAIDKYFRPVSREEGDVYG